METLLYELWGRIILVRIFNVCIDQLNNWDCFPQIVGLFIVRIPEKSTVVVDLVEVRLGWFLNIGGILPLEVVLQSPQSMDPILDFCQSKL